MARGAGAVSQGQEVILSVGEDMNSVAGHARIVEQRMREIEHVLEQQNEATQEVTGSISRINELTAEAVSAAGENAASLDRTVDLIDEELSRISKLDVPHKIIYLAKADHIIWKKRLADMFAGRTSLSEDELASHEHCRLGIWYYSDQAAAYRGKREFAALEAPHREVHQCGIAAVAAFNRGDLDTAMQQLERVQKSSVDVIEMLDTLKS